MPITPHGYGPTVTERSLKSVSRRAPAAGRGSGSAKGGESARRVTAATAARKAKEQIQDLVGFTAEQVTAVSRLDEGWSVTVEVLELRRIPETMDVLGVYDVELSRRGDVVGWRRTGRHYRSDMEGG